MPSEFSCFINGWILTFLTSRSPLMRYLDPNSVLDWIGLRIRTNIKKTYWRGCTVADKIQVLLNSFDLSTLATLLGQSTNSDGGEQVNCKKQNIHHHKESKEHFREKKIARKPHPSALPIGGDVCTDIVTELDEEANQFSLYSLEKPGNPSSPNTQRDTDITSGSKRRLMDKNDRKRTISDWEEKVQAGKLEHTDLIRFSIQTDYGFSRPSKKMKLNGECNNIEDADGEINGKLINSNITRGQVLDVGNDIDTNQNVRDDVSADNSLHGKPVIPMERSQDMGSPGKRKTPKKDRTPTASGYEVKNVIVSPTTSTEKRKASRSNTNIISEVDVLDVGNDIDTNQNVRDDVSADNSLHGKPVIPMERSQDMGSPGKRKTPKKDRNPTVSEKSARLSMNDLATSLDASASLSYVNSGNNVCTSAKLTINNGLNKPATRQSKTIDTAVCKVSVFLYLNICFSQLLCEAVTHCAPGIL
ncbi:unnamed protein product [Schistosoma curassoni]|uniref:ULP_PROTEASE domain-containing protein n=1 Tax=Schistosoma curassoni TaxID=6186 RepID=A0A183KKJ5_9TREM|nr:unnamed protein product [Schistosoma curassoni]